MQGEGLQATLPQDPPVTVLCATHFDADGMLRTKGRALRSPPTAPLPALFWAAGFSFSRAQLIQEVGRQPAFDRPSRCALQLQYSFHHDMGTWDKLKASCWV